MSKSSLLEALSKPPNFFGIALTIIDKVRNTDPRQDMPIKFAYDPFLKFGIDLEYRALIRLALSLSLYSSIKPAFRFFLFPTCEC